MIDITEKNFEATLEATLLLGGPDAARAAAQAARETQYGAHEFIPGGYHKRESAQYDKQLCLLRDDVLTFLYATQPREWDKFKKQHGQDSQEKFFARLAQQIQARGTLDVLRNGLKANGSKFELAYFRPSSGMNEELQKLYLGNIFSEIRQLKYSVKNENSLDLVLFLNGLPIVTAELKNQLTGQTVENAIKQYKTTRDPREPLFAFGRVLAHFALDPDLAYMTTHLQGAQTRFLPFNQGNQNGAGNPPSWRGFATAYLYEQIWARDSLLDLVQNFVQTIEQEDDEGNKTGKRSLIFPRYHQLDTVRRLLADARVNGAGKRYLIQHSAGSGKSNSIAWLAHQLTHLHDAHNRNVFDSVVVITDRRVLDRQLQRTVRQFEQTLGLVENIDQTSSQLQDALAAGEKIIVTTLQKFPVIAREMQTFSNNRFAVIIDEAHSSQGGEANAKVQAVLAPKTLAEAEAQEMGAEEDLQDRVIAEIKKRGPLPNVSYFAFTATPKPQTLELFGVKQLGGEYAPFSLYSMRQAIQENFILDVLENYTTYKAYWSLLKRVADDPRYDRRKATYLLRSFVELHESTIAQKAAIMVAHFAEHVAPRIGGKAKAMIVTRSRLHAVRYKLAVDKILRERGCDFQALVAFSGTVKDPDDGLLYTETEMNTRSAGKSIGEKQTAQFFKQDEFRLLIVAEKFQTGFDQPLLYAMYVDKVLRGLHAVQTLSRLNRVHPEKDETVVLDFANEPDDIQKGFEPYYDRLLLKEATDPNLLYDLETRLADYRFFTGADVKQFADVYFDPKATQDKLHAALAPTVARYTQASDDERAGFRGFLQDYTRLYSFLSQIITFVDADLERLYVFGRLLLRKLPVKREQLPVEIQKNIDMESYRVQKTSSGKIKLARGTAELEPESPKGIAVPNPEEIEPLSQIIQELNDRFGANLGAQAMHSIQTLETKLAADPALNASVHINTPDNARLTFDHVATDHLQEMIDSDFKFYKQVTDDPDFAKQLFDWLFERYRKTKT